MSSEPILSDSELTEEITEQREEVLTYKPGNVSTCADSVDFPEQLYIGLFGRTGCGKTSLINSLKFAAHGKLRRAKWLQVAGQEKSGGHTMFRKLADITKKISVIDNRGLDDPNTEKAIAELAAQLDGKRGFTDIVEWQGANDGNDSDDLDDEDLDLSKPDLNKGYPIGCAVFVFSARHDIDTNTTGLSEVIDFLHSHQGRYPVAIITHVDVAEKNHLENLKTVLRVSGVSDIFEVANLTHMKPFVEVSYQHRLLSFLERCMTDGDETLIFKHHQRKEQQRKKKNEGRREEKKRNQEEERRKQEEERRKQEEERRRQEENKRKQQEGRIAAEFRQNMIERERTERDNQIRRELEEQRRVIKRGYERAEELERDRRERERDQRYDEAIKKAEVEKQAEIRRIMEANKNNESGCEIM